MTLLAVYIHWPYCISKCPYCDFNSQPIGTVNHKAWAKAYEREIEYYARLLTGREIGSIYFGGGTPSLMEPSAVATVLEKIAKSWRIAKDCEITLEANPSSSEIEKFKAFRKAGVNRISLGVQSLRDDALRFLGRLHDVDDAKRAIEAALAIFPRFSFDLIYGRNNQSPKMWEEELCEAFKFEPNHLSLYQLTIEPNTRFAALAEEFHLVAPEEDIVAMYEVNCKILQQKGLFAYEVSNYAVPGEESRHNLAYWNYNDYLGIGPSAHGRFVHRNVRHATENLITPDEWLKQVTEEGHGMIADEILDNNVAQCEALIMGLRLAAGIKLDVWREKFGMDLFDFLPENKLHKLHAEGLIVIDSNNLRATEKGLQRLDSVLKYLLS